MRVLRNINQEIASCQIFFFQIAYRALVMFLNCTAMLLNNKGGENMPRTKQVGRPHETGQRAEKKNMMKKMAPVAAGVAITAGVVAAGVMLADKRNREKLGKTMEKGFKSVKEIAEKRDYPAAITHTIGLGKKGRKSRGTSRARSHQAARS